MATNKNRQRNKETREEYRLYYGVDGSYALKPQPIEEPARRRKTRVVVKTKAAPEAKRMALAVCAVAVGLIMALTLVQRCAVISMNNTRLLAAEQIIAEYEREEAYLDVELARRGDITQIAQTARSEMNMGYPDAGQIYYFSYAQEEESAARTANTSSNFFDGVCEWIHGVLGRIGA